MTERLDDEAHLLWLNQVQQV